MSIAPLFVDSSAFYALADRHDASHRLATQRWEAVVKAKRPLVTSLAVAAETATLVRRSLGFDAVQAWLDQLDRARLVGAIELAFLAEREYALARDLYRQLAQPKLSFVDALSFSVMTLRGIHTCFGFDEDFLSAGFALYE
ncbi:MAG: PIN domain-containing protein [Candidatus Omnitrophica bacterium]|nr:PIN domain-containing protein [Candidatus Omnitrophota bacterium]MBI3083350.1 PIN domain-containing protein [Candidatus Omnitrophota bacterium]